MVNVTFSVPPELHKLMDKHDDVKWGVIARRAMWEKAKELELLDKLTSKSKLTLEGVEELDEIIKDATWKRLSRK